VPVVDPERNSRTDIAQGDTLRRYGS
jgi:hypothetical protein